MKGRGRGRLLRQRGGKWFSGAQLGTVARACTERSGSAIRWVLGCAPHDKGQPMTSYDDYVKDEKFLALYNDYQKRYASEIAERDKLMLRLIAERTSGKGRLVDIG